jgi:malonyl-CoA O-methyltransferase
MKSAKHAFSRAAPRYDAYASQQREVVERLVTLAKPHLSAQPKLLDVGCGTGYFKAHTGWPIIGCDLAYGMCAQAQRHDQLVFASDMHQLAVADGSLEGIFSSLALQWSDDPADALKEWHRAVKPEGLVVFSTYLLLTLNELYKSFKVLNEASPLRAFYPHTQIINIINSAEFELLEAHENTLKRDDKSLVELVSYMKKIGANVSASNMLKTRSDWQRLEDAYPKTDGLIRSSWQVGYYVLRKKP